MHSSVKEKEIVEKRTNFAQWMDSNKENDGSFKSATPAVVKEFHDREKELGDLQAEYASLKSMEDMAKSLEDPQRGFDFAPGTTLKSGSPYDQARQMVEGAYKSLGQSFVETTEYKSRAASHELADKNFEWRTEVKHASVKTLFQTTAGFAPFIPRTGPLIYTPQYEPAVSDLIPSTDTTAAGIRYMEETVYTNNAAAVAEGATKPEAVLQLVERLLLMSKVAVTLPVTEEQMADVPTLKDYLDNRLTLMLRQEEDRELLLGSGTGNEMLGFLNKPGIQTLAKGSLDSFSALLQMIVQIESTVGFANVSGTVMHPLDWYSIRVIKDGMGRFVMGNPDHEGPATLWGKPIVRTVREPQGTILMGDFRTYSQILRREGINFRMGYVANQFIQNIMTILAEFRELLIIYRASAFGTVTGTFTS